MYSLGQLFDAGMTAEEFDNAFTGQSFISSEGFNTVQFDYETYGRDFQMVWVPEPASFAAVTLGGLGLIRRRTG